MNSQANIIFGFLSLIVAYITYYDYQKDQSIYVPNVGDFYGPGVIYFVIAVSSFFTFFGFLCFYLAWKEYKQEKKRDINEKKPHPGSNHDIGQDGKY